MLLERAESDDDPAELRDRNDKRNGTPRPVLPEAPVLGGSESIPPWSRSNRATTLHRWRPTKLGLYTMEVCHIHSTPDGFYDSFYCLCVLCGEAHIVAGEHLGYHLIYIAAWSVHPKRTLYAPYSDIPPEIIAAQARVGGHA